MFSTASCRLVTGQGPNNQRRKQNHHPKRLTLFCLRLHYTSRVGREMASHPQLYQPLLQCIVNLIDVHEVLSSPPTPNPVKWVSKHLPKKEHSSAGDVFNPKGTMRGGLEERGRKAKRRTVEGDGVKAAIPSR